MTRPICVGIKSPEDITPLCYDIKVCESQIISVKHV